MDSRNGSLLAITGLVIIALILLVSSPSSAQTAPGPEERQSPDLQQRGPQEDPPWRPHGPWMTRGNEDQCRLMGRRISEWRQRVAEMDAKLNGLVQNMNTTTGEAKTDAMAAVINELIIQRRATLRAHMAMEGSMMRHMGEHAMRGMSDEGRRGMNCCPMMHAGDRDDDDPIDEAPSSAAPLRGGMTGRQDQGMAQMETGTERMGSGRERTVGGMTEAREGVNPDIVRQRDTSHQPQPVEQMRESVAAMQHATNEMREGMEELHQATGQIPGTEQMRRGVQQMQHALDQMRAALDQMPSGGPARQPLPLVEHR